MLKASWEKYTLHFKQPVFTSRGGLRQKDSWFIFIRDSHKQDITGIGECGLLKGLSIDDRDDYEDKLKWICENIHLSKEILFEELTEFPSIRFGLETAFIDYENGGTKILFSSDFTNIEAPVIINGLVWMGSVEFMKKQIREKIEAGFRCIKIKIGAIDFEKELDILKIIRKEYNVREIELRVDANGAFMPDEALEKLKRLSEFDIHSIEQPIARGQVDEMAFLCQNSPVPVALDEELTGVFTEKDKEDLLKIIQPQFIILKPSLVGGFNCCNNWIRLAEEQNTGWWITSALESDIGLNAIAQWTYTLNITIPQGLGTGMLYKNNFHSPLEIRNGRLIYNKSANWDLSSLLYE